MKMNIKKIMSLVLAIIMIATCTACSAKDTADDTSTEHSLVDTKPSYEIPSINTSEFLKLPSEGDGIEAYRAEVSKRIKAMEADEDVKFSTPEEIEFLESNGYDLSYRGIEMAEYSDTYMELEVYTYPIVYVGENDSVQVWSITKYGDIYAKAIVGKVNSYSSSDYLGDAHCPEESDSDEIIRSERGFAVVHNEKNNQITFWSLGEMICQHDLPENSVYCGFSDWVGYLFRAGTDVYALADFGTIQANSKDMCTIKPIAHNVQMVIDADYYMGSDDWAQPLFLMTDGTVKGYCDWVGDEDAPSDDPSHLYDIRHEGGYDK